MIQGSKGHNRHIRETTFDQDIAKEICRQIDDCIRQHHSKCRSYLAPTDVCLDCDEYTVVQPDVFVVCDKKKITKKNIQGAPDLIVEVLSPSSRKKDLFEKAAKYVRSGVMEYWVVDPDHQSVVTYDFRNAGAIGTDGLGISIHGFSDKIPVLISGGTCVIDMNPIRALLEELYS